MDRSIPLLLLSVFLAGCAANIHGSLYGREAAGAAASDSGEEMGDYSRLTVAFLPSERTLDGMRERPSNFKGGAFYQPEIWLTNLQLRMGDFFKGVTKVKSQRDAKTVNADLIAVVDCVGELTGMTNQLTLEIGATFTAMDGTEIASVRAKNKKKGNMFYTNPAASADDALQRFVHQMRFSRELAAFAKEYRGAPVAAAAIARAPKPVENVDVPGYSLPARPDDYALVVGVGKYSALPEAPYAEQDAESVKKHLVALGLPERNIIILSGAKATRSMLQGYLQEWLPKNVKADSRVFFYFSGHGAPDPKTGEAFLVPWDGSASFLQSTAYPLKELYKSLGGLKAKSVLIALDSCFSGAGGRSVLAEGARPLVMKLDEAALPRQGMTLFTAASGDEITATLPEKGHGLFTYFFLKGLSGAAKDPSGRVTAKGLYDYLKPNVQDEAHRQNREQTPVFQGACPDCELARF